MSEFSDYIGEIIAAVGVIFVWVQTNRQRQKDRERSAEERGSNKEWRDGVNAQLNRRRTEHEELMEHVESLRAAGNKEHTELRTEMHENFKSTDQLINGMIGEVRELRGELHGSGVLRKHDE